MTNHSDTKCCLCFQTIQRTYVNWLIIFAVEVSSSSASSMTFTTTSSAASPYAGQFFPRYFTWPETTITERFKLTCFIWYLQKKKIKLIQNLPMWKKCFWKQMIFEWVMYTRISSGSKLCSLHAELILLFR